MALQSNIQLYIGGTPIPSFKRLYIHQEIAAHHDIELLCRMDVLETLSGELGGMSKSFLGEPIIVEVSSVDVFNGYELLEFKGLVTSVNNTKGFSDSSGDLITIRGKSTTILADDGPHYASHNEVGLSDILQKTFSGYDTSKLTTAFEPVGAEPLDYSVQHQESSWDYANRLAAQYSEWFYYDGKKLIFGKPEDSDVVKLRYGVDLQQFSLELNPQPNNFNYFTNDYLTDEQHTKKTSEVEAPNGYNGFASEKSQQIYAKETNVWINGYTDTQLKKRLDKQVEQQKKAADQRQVIVNGKSDNPGVGLGKVVSLMGDIESYGSYRITRVSHTITENGRYQNHFEALTAEMDVYPQTNFNAIPRSDTQTAVVTENADPDGIGRIKVQFPWQKMLGEMTPWLRIVSPHAGGDKGFHFIPEVGEEVLIGFEGGNAERPYVMGSLYNGSGKAGAFQNAGNAIKALQTRSGNKVIMNDDDGSITIADPSGNVVVMQGNGEVIIKAPNKLTLMSTDINILAGNKIYLEAKPNEEGGGDGIIAMMAQQSFDVKTVDESISMKAKTDVTLTSETASMNLNGKTDTNIKGETSLNLRGNEINVTGDSKIKVESSDTDIF